MNHAANQIIQVTETLMRSLKDIEYKSNQIEKLRNFVSENKASFLIQENESMDNTEKQGLITSMEKDLAKLDDLVKGHAEKLKSICAQYDLEIAYEVAETLNKWFK